MTSTYKQVGDTVNYTAGGTISKGDELVLGSANNVSLGIAQDDAVSGDVIAVAVEGVFLMPKVSGAVIVQGEAVNWDELAGAVDDNAATSAAGDIANFGMAMESKGNGDTTILVKLLPGNGVIGT